ncbi:GGDEF domain-containing protein [Paraglaciecola aquimarina]|uniref:diguanylate cyclase n=1 Tax=Paraglaciecola algarum TaxID=3050085 RepID=A0ABS9D5P9_9ALTE|nr:GGDEF domain-containing protein [Paraglaciecola sp. G1-23]MCF2948297.1 GGDEF domain-containing protein [Paraglaciecola sp. G1-23]
MIFSENSSQAADYLRQAVPTMMKHNIVPDPLNYTLWYSYYSKSFPQLNKELEQVIERYQTCPPAIAQTLFIQHISQIDKENDEKELDTFQKAILKLVDNLSDSLDITAKQTDGFSKALIENVNTIETLEVNEDVSAVLNALNENASAICNANQEFQGQLSSAQSEINSLKNELEKSKREANTDPLTGLCNRRVLESVYHSFIDDEGEQLALIIMDIDKFKNFNDTHGHVLGDQILKFVGQLLEKECDDPVIAIRLGGEEFALFCPNFSLNQAKELSEKIRLKLSSTPYTNKRTGDKINPVTASFGITQRSPTDNLISIIERADKALYKAKDSGRDRVEAIL